MRNEKGWPSVVTCSALITSSIIIIVLLVAARGQLWLASRGCRDREFLLGLPTRIQPQTLSTLSITSHISHLTNKCTHWTNFPALSGKQLAPRAAVHA